MQPPRNLLVMISTLALIAIWGTTLFIIILKINEHGH